MGQIQGGYRGPDIVGDGLILYLDAGSPNSYRQNFGTTWRDMSGNGNNGTLTLGPTFNSANGGSIVLDGTNDYVSISGTRTLTTLTMICWIRRDGNLPSYSPIMFTRTNSTGMNIGPTSQQLGYHYRNNASTYSFSSNLIIPNLTWCMVAYVQESTQGVLYLNTSSVTNPVGAAETVLNNFVLGIDTDFPATRIFKGNIAISMLYNRNLSSTEVTQNFNAAKTRFGL